MTFFNFTVTRAWNDCPPNSDPCKDLKKFVTEQNSKHFTELFIKFVASGSSSCFAGYEWHIFTHQENDTGNALKDLDLGFTK
jgi:hypothetical protein